MSTRNRVFCGICYEEQIKLVRQYLTDFTSRGTIRAYYLIKHNPETEDKQLHFHFLIEFYDAKTKSSIAKNIGIEERFINVCTDLRGYACYLIHKYELEKERYNPRLVESNDKERYFQLINSENANEIDCDKLVTRKFIDLVENTEFTLSQIFKCLVYDKNITIRTIRRNAYFYKTYYESERGEKIVRD